LIKRGRNADAAQSLSRLTSASPTDPEIEVELDEIRANLEVERRLGESSYLDCFRPSHNRIALRTLTGIFIQAYVVISPATAICNRASSRWQQLTGINFIFYYGTTFFNNSGIKNPFLILIATNVVNVGMTIPGIWGVERFGRRRLLLVGAIGMCICEFIVAIVGITISVDNLTGQRVLIAFVCIYIVRLLHFLFAMESPTVYIHQAFFASTWGPVAWVITGEIFPLNVRAKAMSMSVASNWLWNFGIGYASM
jgi:MFS family permease